MLFRSTSAPFDLLITAKGSEVYFPTDPWEQLRRAIEAVFRSWNIPRAVTYRKINRISGGQELQRGDRVRTKGTNLFLTDRNGVPIGIGIVSGERVRSLK